MLPALMQLARHAHGDGCLSGALACLDVLLQQCVASGDTSSLHSVYRSGVARLAVDALGAPPIGLTATEAEHAAERSACTVLHPSTEPGADRTKAASTIAGKCNNIATGHRASGMTAGMNTSGSFDSKQQGKHGAAAQTASVSKTSLSVPFTFDTSVATVLHATNVVVLLAQHIGLQDLTSLRTAYRIGKTMQRLCAMPAAEGVVLCPCERVDLNKHFHRCMLLGAVCH